MLTYHIEPPDDNWYEIEMVMRQAFEAFMKKGYNNQFNDIYDLVHEEIENNFEKYQADPEYAFFD